MRRRDFTLGNSTGGPEAILVGPFCDRFADLGFVANSTSLTEYRWSEGLPQQLEPFALDSIWKGAKHVEAPGKDQFLLNTGAAEQPCLVLAASLLARADEVIE